MAEQNRVEIRVTASGAEQAAKILNQVAKEGGQLGSVTASGAKQAEAAIGGLTKNVQGLSALMGQAGINTGVLGNAIGALTSPAGLAAAAFSALGLAISRTTTFMQDNYKQLRQLQAVSGLSLEAADQLADTFDLLGLNTEALSAAMFKMSQEIDTGGESLRALGVNIRDAGGALKAPGELFLEVRDKISGLSSAAEKNAVIMQAFGRQGRELAAVFALSATEFDKYMQKAGLLGPSAEESARVTKEYTLAQAELNKVLQGFIETAGIKLLPILTDVVKAIQSLVQTSDSMSTWIQTQVGGMTVLVDLWEKYKNFQRFIGVRAAEPPKPPVGNENPTIGFGGGGGGKAAAEIKVVTDELKKMQDQLEVMRASPLDQPIVKLEQAFRAFAEKAGPEATKQMRAFTDAAIGLERAKQAETAMTSLNATMGALAKTMADMAAKGGLLATLFPPTDDDKMLQDLNEGLEQARGKILAMKDTLSEGDLAARLKVFDAGAESVKTWAANLIKSIDATRQAKEEAKAFYDALPEKIEAAGKAYESTQFSMENWMATLTKDDALEEAQRFYDELPKRIQTAANAVTAAKQPFDDAARAGLTFQESLAAIGREAALMGPSFDAASAELDLFKRRILELQAIKNPTGEILSEIDQLKAKFADTKDFIQWRTAFENLFSSVGQAVNTLVQGVILGTQTMGQAFKKLAEAIITQFVNAVIQQALNPLVKAAAGVVAGLFSAGAKVAGAASSAGTGSSGDIDIGGPSMATQLQGAADSVGNFASGLSTATNATSLWTSTTTAAQAGWSTFNASLATGEGTISALGSAWNAASGTFSAASGAISGLTIGLAGVGAAVAAFGTIMDFVNGKTEAAIGGVSGAAVGGVAGGVIGSYFGPGGTALGALMGAALGDALGSWLGGMFGGPSNYELKRIQAADEANKALGNLTHGFEAALKTFDSSAVLAALSGGGGGASGNSVRTELVLPTSLAQQIGITGEQIGDKLVAQWSSLTLEQFDKVIAAFKEQPDLVQNIRGSGDVPLLAGGDAEAVAGQIADGAKALLAAFVEMQAVRDRIKTLAVDLSTAAREVLPAGAADAFAGRVNDFRDRMLAVLSSGLPVAEMQKQMAALETELRNYTGLVDLYAQNTQLIAKLSADFVTQTRGAVLAIRTSLTAADRAVSNAQSAANRAMTPEAELKATTALRDAIVNRYQMELDMVNKLEASLASIAAKQGAVQQTLNELAVIEVGRGDARSFNEIYMALADLAMVAPTAAQRLAAVAQGLHLVLTSLPTTLKSQIDTGSVTAGADIARILSAQVAPFFTSLADMIKAAADAGDLQGQLGLLERQADLIKQVGSALVQAINDWAAAASDAVRKLADVKFADINKNWDDFADASRAAAVVMRDGVNKNWDTFAEASHTAADAMKVDINKNWDDLRDGVTKAADVAIKGEQDKIDAIELATKTRQKQIDLEIKGIENATKAQQKAIAAHIDALQAQLAASKEWEQLAKATGELITSLNLSSQAPLNPADQLGLAGANLDKLFAQFQAAPSAALGTDVTKAAQDFLAAEQNVNTRTSVAYQEAYAKAMAILGGVQGTAGGMVSTPSDEIAAQIDALRISSEAIGEDAATRIEALREQSATLNETAKEQIDVLRGGIDHIKDLLGAELKRIDEARKHDLDLVDAWLKVRDTEIKQGRAYDLSVIDGWLKVREKEITDGRAYDLGVVKGWLDAQLASIEATRKGTVEGIQDGMIAALRTNASEQNRILGILEAGQSAALDAITKGVPLEQFKAKAAADTVSELEKLNGQIEKFLLGSGHAKGLAYVPATGAYKLHQGERVLTREERIAYEGGMAQAPNRGGAPSITYAPTVNVSGGGDPALIKACVAEALRRDRRDFLRELETGAAGARLRG